MSWREVEHAFDHLFDVSLRDQEAERILLRFKRARSQLLPVFSVMAVSPYERERLVALDLLERMGGRATLAAVEDLIADVDVYEAFKLELKALRDTLLPRVGNQPDDDDEDEERDEVVGESTDDDAEAPKPKAGRARRRRRGEKGDGDTDDTASTDLEAVGPNLFNKPSDAFLAQLETDPDDVLKAFAELPVKKQVSFLDRLTPKSDDRVWRFLVLQLEGEEQSVIQSALKGLEIQRAVECLPFVEALLERQPARSVKQRARALVEKLRNPEAFDSEPEAAAQTDEPLADGDTEADGSRSDDGRPRGKSRSRRSRGGRSSQTPRDEAPADAPTYSYGNAELEEESDRPEPGNEALPPEPEDDFDDRQPLLDGPRDDTRRDDSRRDGRRGDGRRGDGRRGDGRRDRRPDGRRDRDRSPERAPEPPNERPVERAPEPQADRDRDRDRDRNPRRGGRGRGGAEGGQGREDRPRQDSAPAQAELDVDLGVLPVATPAVRLGESLVLEGRLPVLVSCLAGGIGADGRQRLAIFRTGGPDLLDRVDLLVGDDGWWEVCHQPGVAKDSVPTGPEWTKTTASYLRQRLQQAAVVNAENGRALPLFASPALAFVGSGKKVETEEELPTDTQPVEQSLVEQLLHHPLMANWRIDLAPNGAAVARWLATRGRRTASRLRKMLIDDVIDAWLAEHNVEELVLRLRRQAHLLDRSGDPMAAVVLALAARLSTGRLRDNLLLREMAYRGFVRGVDAQRAWQREWQRQQWVIVQRKRRTITGRTQQTGPGGRPPRRRR